MATAPAKSKLNDEEALRPSYEAAVWEWEHGGLSRTYVQKPLTALTRVRFYALIAKVIDEAMKGADGLTISGLIGENESDGDIATINLVTGRMLSNSDAFLQALTKLLVYAPTLLVDCFNLWLNVPAGEQVWAAEAMSANMDDDDLIKIIETFIGQNGESMRDFWQSKLPNLARKAAQLTKR